MDESEIRDKLISNEPAILKQSLDFVNEKLTLERARSTKAEGRSATVFAVTGIMAGFVVQFAKLIDSTSQNKWFTVLLYAASILFLLKAALFAIKSLLPLNAYELTPQLIFDIQKMSEVDAIREETVWKIWEYYELLPITNRRLFDANRAQRNLFVAIISFALLGIVWFSGQLGVLFPRPVIILVTALLAILVCFFDTAIERFGNFWKFY